MSRMDTHPIAFFAGEAIADRAVVAIVAWETHDGLKIRLHPGNSLAVLIGLHDMLAVAIDAMRGVDEADDDDDAEDA